MAAPILELSDVTFRYAGVHGVEGISFALRTGRFVGVLGPNGSGKSTITRLAAGLLRPDRGTVRLAGRDLARVDGAERGRRIAFMPQESPLPTAFTGREIVLLGRTPHLGWLMPEGDRDRAVAAEALRLAGAVAFAERPATDLSGGERQRLLFARALAQEPDVLLLDEPTCHLDLAHALALLRSVRMLTCEGELAALGVFHEINLAIEFCDELIFLVDGHVAARGAPETVVTPDLLRSVYGLDLPIIRHPESGRPAVLYPSAFGPVSYSKREELSHLES